MWRAMIVPSRMPAMRAAMVKSCSRSSSSLPRTTRASEPQRTSERMTTMPKYTCSTDHSRGRAAASAIHSGMVGIDMMNSMTR